MGGYLCLLTYHHDNRDDLLQLFDIFAIGFLMFSPAAGIIPESPENSGSSNSDH